MCEVASGNDRAGKLILLLEITIIIDLPKAGRGGERACNSYSLYNLYRGQNAKGYC